MTDRVTPPDDIPNPIVLQRADPCVLRHEGTYYFTASHPAYDRIVLRGAERLAALQAADEVTIWERHTEGPRSHLIWAPELHRVDGRWYVYYAAAPDETPKADVPGANETFNHRIYVLECAADDPLTGEWVDRGQVDTGWESFALDATSFVLDGRQYLVWAQQDNAIRGHSNLYIAPMANPWTLGGPAVLLTRPEFDWEIKGFWVNEGPSVLVREGRVFLTYSGAATGIDYAMGLLTADAGGDLLDPASWTKSPDPVFVSEPAGGQYGPGHNSFTTTEDGDTVLVYHARTYTEIVGDPLRDPNRHARAQILPFDADGEPVWGVPVADTRPTPSADETAVLPATGLSR
ncbi:MULTISPECIES: glycoside hydrolase family 43 protein [unclassified Streptomyces]|uniref:glycoside hydrolase family 43 protein n=1 Tax=unclassified Streptomyces TaxID=2593676 RepID=UPI00278BD0CD|nr:MULTISPECIES: glycoside hydrolase family 43 protein [unclassified Streptomyces]